MSTEKEVAEESFDPFEAEEASPEVEQPEVEVEEVEEVVEEEEAGNSTDDPDEEDPKGESEEEKSATSQKEKMIPESRFKAAIKDIQEKLDKALQENAQYKATPTPDRESDPDGYERHLRLETSKVLMREFKEDYEQVIAHYQEMAKVNPSLNEIVANNELPAKLAYDLAKRDLEIRELTEARNSDEWKEFQEFKKNRGKAQSTVADDLALPTNKAVKLPKNLNRATAVSPKGKASPVDDDYLWSDSQF